MNVLLLSGLIQRFVDRVLVRGGSTVVVDALIDELNRTLRRLEMVGEI